MRFLSIIAGVLALTLHTPAHAHHLPARPAPKPVTVPTVGHWTPCPDPRLMMACFTR